jgi:hypothetical protein
MADALAKHAFVSAIPEGTDATKIRTSNWNAALLFSAGTDGQVLTRSAASATGAAWSTPAAPDLSGLVVTTRTVNGHALSADVTVSKSDVGLALVENTALSTWAGSANLVTVGTLANLTVTNPIVGSVTGASSSTSGNAATATLAAAATVLATPRAINGVAFDGSAAITVPAAAGTLTGTTLAAGVTGAPQTWAGLQTFSGGAAITGIITTNVNGIAATSTDGSILQNATPATAGVPAQWSPRARLSGTAWDTTATASKTVDFFAEVLPVSSATPTGQLKIGYSLNGAAVTYPMILTAAGGLTLLGSLFTSGAFGVNIGQTGALGWVGRAQMRSPADGAVTILSNTESIGSRLKADALPTIASGFGAAAAITAGSTPLAGSVNTGAASASGVINFNGTAFPSAPFVVVTNLTTGLAVKYTVSTTQLTLSPATGNFGANDVVAWIAISPK